MSNQVRENGKWQQLKIRSMAAVDAWLFKTGQASWSDWSLASAVNEGYKKSGWVYRAVSLTSRAGSSVPWVVYNEKNEMELEHPLTKMFANPNPQFSRQDIFELLISWRQLGGEAYLKRAFGDGQRTKELWPISPDRIAPIASGEQGVLLKGYSVINEKGVQEKISSEYTPENMVHFKILDPSNPLNGIGPLQAAARAVDTDIEQQNWNKSAMENRGVFDGVFTFKQDLTGSQHATILEKIKERFSGSHNARTPGVIGSDAKYTRMSVTPAEMDFLNSRKFNREEIFTIFGVPSQLAGAIEASTYNNYLVSLRIFWENTIIPMLDDIADTFNNAMRSELEDGRYRIGYDTSGVTALRESENEKAKTAESYWKMGVPLSNINEKLELGINAFENWDKPWTGGKAPIGNKEKEPVANEEKSSPVKLESREWNLIPFEKRNIEEEQEDRDKIAEGKVKNMFDSLLRSQREAVFAAMESDGENPIEVIKSQRDTWLSEMRLVSTEIAVEFSSTVILNKRSGKRPQFYTRDAVDNEIMDAIEAYLVQENIMLQDLSFIESTTAKSITDAIADAINTGATVQETQQTILDLGVFSEERSLMLARTLTGTASSIGQMAGAEAAGATSKIWMNSGFEVREEHIARNEETVNMNKRFSDQGYGAPRFPLDPEIEPADRVNCRCSMVFK